MHDWAAPLIASALFAFLSPGLILQFPGKESPVGFMNMKTTVASIFVHTILYAMGNGFVIMDRSRCKNKPRYRECVSVILTPRLLFLPLQSKSFSLPCSVRVEILCHNFSWVHTNLQHTPKKNLRRFKKADKSFIDMIIDFYLLPVRTKLLEKEEC
ncbi:hypothetical protein N665_0188s0237 [Sinapis alba]|nr:hypothetical protein N665_0188s0237 [Sinapis alba]